MIRLSPSVHTSIEKLKNLSPIAKQLLERASVATSLSAAMENAEEVDNDTLMRDNIALKQLVVSLSNTISSMEKLLEEVTRELEAYNEGSVVRELSEKTKQIMRDNISASDLSFLQQVYTKSVFHSMQPDVRRYLAILLVERYSDAGIGDKIPQIWRNIASSEGQM